VLFLGRSDMKFDIPRAQNWMNGSVDTLADSAEFAFGSASS